MQSILAKKNGCVLQIILNRPAKRNAFHPEIINALTCMKVCDFHIPIVTQVHGHVFGGGIGLCAASDIVIADRHSIFSLSELRRGLIPAVMMPFIIETFGKSRVRELLITGREFTSAEAMNFGLVHFISQQNTELTLTNNIIKNIFANAPEAIQNCRFLINHSVQLSKHHFAECLAKKRINNEAKEGLATFFEKIQPAWEKESQF